MLLQTALSETFLKDQYIKAALSHMHREPPVTSTRVKCVKVTSVKAELIRKYHNQHPWLSQLEVANFFRTNPGRVSEALNNLR